jgi:hypothetical protein
MVAYAIEPDVKLVEYSFIEESKDEVGISCKVVIDTSEKDEVDRGWGVSIPISEHFARRPELKPIFDKLIAEIKEHVDPELDVEEGKNFKATKTSIVFKRKINYVYLDPRSDGFNVWILGVASEPNERVKPVMGSWWLPQKWGHVKVSKIDDINDKLISWIRKAYDKAG